MKKSDMRDKFSIMIYDKGMVPKRHGKRLNPLDWINFSKISEWSVWRPVDPEGLTVLNLVQKDGKSTVWYDDHAGKALKELKKRIPKKQSMD